MLQINQQTFKVRDIVWGAMMSLDMTDRMMGNYPAREPAPLLMLSSKMSSKIEGERESSCPAI